MSKQPLPHRLALSILLLASASLAAAPASAWQYTFDGGNRALEDALAVAVDDRTGHVVAAGTLSDPDLRFTFFAAKVNRQHGHEIWRFQLPDASGRARSVALGPDGQVAVAGESTRGQLTVVQLDAETGAPHWVTRIPGGDAFGVAVDAAGDVIAAGVLDGQMGVVKLSGADGSELWRAHPNAGGSRGQVRALALDAAGDPVVTGWSANADGRATMPVFKLDGADGEVAWGHVIEPSPFAPMDEGVAVAVDPSGDVVATGTIGIFADNAISFELTVLKLSGDDGSLAWRRDLSPGIPSDRPRSLALDAAGDVVAVGLIADDAGLQAAVVKLSGEDGSDLWRRFVDDRSTDRVTVDPVGDVITAGVVFDDPTRFDIVVRKLAGATGDPVWRSVIAGADDGDDVPRAVLTDADGHVVVSGHLVGAGTGTDFAILKLDGATGEDFTWRGDQGPPR